MRCIYTYIYILLYSIISSYYIILYRRYPDIPIETSGSQKKMDILGSHKLVKSLGSGRSVPSRLHLAHTWLQHPVSC